MKIVVRYFFKTVRLVAGPFVLFVNWITMPKGIDRPAAEQKKLDEKTKSLILYQFKTCPFCIRVRREKKRLSLNFEIRDAQKNQIHRDQLLKGGGKIKVPCLNIKNELGNDFWIYESKAIVEYLRGNYSNVK